MQPQNNQAHQDAAAATATKVFIFYNSKFIKNIYLSITSVFLLSLSIKVFSYIRLQVDHEWC